ncbi:NUDIX domain-containing protein [Nonomuraea rhizosphaerae]|uniref:NUDIX domain-containing protein n=1 Tax=Nonomuraea rhizosphaerae TaxID=2665663 RepID=UPI001C5D5D7B|nr:NUDIX domain-containing protein [Nonomuraea rhizosphaerae]
MTDTPQCCRTSVGVIIERDGAYLMFERAKFPPGIAPVAGHVLDEHGSFEAAAHAEVRQEVGLQIIDLTLVWADFAANRCRRQINTDEPGHEWQVYWARTRGELAPSAEETRNLRWVELAELQHLADVTVAYALGHLTDAEFAERPGLEPVWVQWFFHLGHIELARDGDQDQALARLEAIQALYARAPQEVGR